MFTITKTPPTRSSRFPPRLRGIKGEAGFTLIELLVTVTIIAIVSGVMITPFKMLSDGMDIKDRTNYITDMISSLDDSVRQGKVGSYEALFTTGSIGFVTDQDWYKQGNRVSLDFDFVSHSGVLYKAFTGAWTYGVLNLDDSKTVSDRQFVGSGVLQTDIVFPQGDPGNNYKIDNMLDNSNLESFLIRYYDLPDATDIADNPTRLARIESTLTGSGYAALKMQSINGTRMIFGYTGAIDTTKPDRLTGVRLVFEKDETPMTVIIGGMGW